MVVTLTGAAVEVPGDTASVDGYIGGDMAPFAALAGLAPSAKAYVQGLPAPCAKDPAPLYDPARNPLLALPACATAGLDTLAADFKKPKAAPAFAYVVPDMCHDARDADGCAGGGTGAERAASWLKEWVPRITRSKAFKDGRRARRRVRRGGRGHAVAGARRRAAGARARARGIAPITGRSQVSHEAITIWLARVAEDRGSRSN